MSCAGMMQTEQSEAHRLSARERPDALQRLGVE
jgi:hypothetical protein